MTADRRVVKKAAQFLALAGELREDGLAAGGELPHPIFWPGLAAGELEQEWDDLRRWVEHLRVRFPNLMRIPECWWRHNDLVEVLAALRDFERGCFSHIAPATAAVDWHRALRDMETRMETWIKRLTCSVAGRGHQAHAEAPDRIPDGWAQFVRDDADRRRRAALIPGGRA